MSPARAETTTGEWRSTPKARRGVLIYDLILLLGAVGVFVLTSSHTDEVGRIAAAPGSSEYLGPIWVHLGTAALVASLVNLWGLHMPGYGGVSVVDALYLGLLMCFGPFGTCVVVLIAAVVRAGRDLFWRKRELTYVAYSILHPVISFGLGGLLYKALSVPQPIFSTPAATAWNVGALGAATVVAGGLESIFSLVYKVIDRELQFYRQMLSLQRIKLYLQIFAPIGLLVASLYELAPVGLLVLLFPMAMIYHSLKNYTELLREARSTIEEMALAVEKRDPYTYQHSERVARYAEKTARRLRMSEEQVEAIVSAGRLHDLGKISVADSILLKIEKLDEDEYQEIKRHPEVGSKVAGKFTLFEEHGEVATLIRQHHEHWNGRGYPDGLWGEQILLGARILAVAETWDALTSDRAYRRALNIDQARETLQAGRGSQFDPQVVDAFLEVIKEGGPS